jgi:hypothetical protein
MGDRANATYQFGGTLSHANAVALVALINDEYGCDIDTYAPPEVANLANTFEFEECNGGVVPVIESWCKQRGLSFLTKCEAGGQFPSTLKIYDATTKSERDCILSSWEPVMSLADFRRVTKDQPDPVAAIEADFASFDPDAFPPLVIKESSDA